MFRLNCIRFSIVFYELWTSRMKIENDMEIDTVNIYDFVFL